MKDKLLIGAVAIIGVLTLFNTYSILSDDSSAAAKSKVAANRVERANNNLDKNTKQNNPTFDPISEQEKNKPAGPKTTIASIFAAQSSKHPTIQFRSSVCRPFHSSGS